jgi:hypothetical protein
VCPQAVTKKVSLKHGSESLNAVLTGNHFGDVEAHSAKLIREYPKPVLWERDAQGPGNRCVDSSRRDWYHWPSTVAHGGVHAHCDYIRHRRSTGQKGGECGQGGVEGGANVFAGIELEGQGRVQAADARENVGRGHIVERGANPLGAGVAVDSIDGRATCAEDGGEAFVAVARNQLLDIFQLVYRRRPGRDRGSMLQQQQQRDHPRKNG